MTSDRILFSENSDGIYTESAHCNPNKKTRRIILLMALFAVTISFTLKQQCPFERVYAYAQPVLQGVSPKGPVEEGNHQSNPALKPGMTNYLFYVMIRENTFVIPTVLWIKGQGFEVKKDTIHQLPVKIPSTNSSGKVVEIELVPSTSKTVLLLTPGPQLNFFAPPVPELQALLDKNELVIEYMWKEETCYFSASKLKKLDPVAAQ